MKKRLLTKAIFISSLCIIIQIFGMQSDDAAIVPNPHQVHQQPNLEKKVEHYRLYSKSVKELNANLEKEILQLKTDKETLRCKNLSYSRINSELKITKNLLCQHTKTISDLSSKCENLEKDNLKLVQALKENEKALTDLLCKHKELNANYLSLEKNLSDANAAVIKTVHDKQAEIQDKLIQTTKNYENQIQSLMKTKTNAQFNNKLLITTLLSSWFFFIIYFLKAHNLTEIIITNIL